MAKSDSRKTEDMTLKEIQPLKKNFDYRDYLERSEAIKDLDMKVSSFVLESDFSVRVGLLLGRKFFNLSPKESDLLIERLLKFPKTETLKNKTDGQKYKLVRVIQHSKKSLEVTLVLYAMENTVLKELPIQIRCVWSDLLDKI